MGNQLEQEKLLSTQKGMCFISGASQRCHFKLFCAPKFPLDKEVATLSDKLDQEKLLSDQKGSDV